jgi:hypothetical protein
MSANNTNILLQNTIEFFAEQLILLNKKIDNLDVKIDNINNKKIDNKQFINNIDWNSIHLY